MAGVKGKSGGARPNSGGARPGAGRKPQEAQTNIVTVGRKTPLEFLLDLMNDNDADDKLRLEAAKTAAQYVHPKKGEGGKKDEKQDAADKAKSGKFAPSAPPRLIVNRG